MSGSLVPRDVARGFDLLTTYANDSRSPLMAGNSWLERHKAGDVPPEAVAAQVALDRAVEGGFFDDFEERQGAGGSAIALRREMQEAAQALVGDPAIAVWFATEFYRDENQIARDRKWRTRLVAVPRSGLNS